MADQSVKGVSGLALLRQPATPALARYLNDLRSTLGFRAYLWQLIVKSDCGPNEPGKSSSELPEPDSAIAQMELHSGLLDEMLFCQAVNSFLTYLADLMTLIYEKYPQKLPSKKQTTYRFSIEHHLAGDLISALAEETVLELTHQNLGDLGKYFEKNLDLALFTKDADRENAALCVDIRNLITHNRGIVNRFFLRRNPRFADALGKRVVLGEKDREEMLSTLGYCARQLDLRAIQKFTLETIEPKFEGSVEVARY